MEKLIDPEKARAIQEEIRTRVFDRYAEQQGLETQQHELQATLDALHDVTQLPLAEIEKIASDVMREYNGAETSLPVSREQFRQIVPAKEVLFDRFRRKLEKKKQGFTIHLLSYVCVNLPLIYINIVKTPSFPWVMFPMLFWGIGLGSHYLSDVRWPAKDLRDRMQALKGQIHQILDENVPRYRTDAQSHIFNGVYRLLVSESSNTTLNEYLHHADPQLDEHGVQLVTTQLNAIREQYIRK